MSNKYTWKINQMDCYLENPQPHCIHTIHWGITATSSAINPDTNQPYTSGTVGAIHIPYEANDNFIPHGELTEEVAISFVEEAMRKHILNEPTGEEERTEPEMNELDALYIYLDRTILDQMKPKNVAPALPWAKA